MKKFFLFVVVLALAAGGWMVWQHGETGVWSLMPVELSPEEKDLLRMERRLAEVEERIAVQHRLDARAGSSGSPGL
jgi:hypothetical protein